MAHKLIFAPEEHGYVKVVDSDLLGGRQAQFIEAEQLAQVHPGLQPLVDGFRHRFSGKTQPLHQRTRADELEEVTDRGDESWRCGESGAQGHQPPPFDRSAV